MVEIMSLRLVEFSYCFFMLDSCFSHAMLFVHYPRLFFFLFFFLSDFLLLKILIREIF
jgi:hypothetical protein